MKEIILDTETTGISVKEGHRIVEIDVSNLIIWYQLKTISLLSKSRRKVWKLWVHGYSDEFLLKQKKFSEIVDEFLAFIDDKRLIIHNAEFDLSHLNNELKILQKLLKTIL